MRNRVCPRVELILKIIIILLIIFLGFNKYKCAFTTHGSHDQLYVSVAYFIWRPIRKLNWNLFHFQLVSDTVQEGSARKTCCDVPRKQKTKVVLPLLEARKQTHLFEIAETRGFWEKEPGSTEKEMEGQHTGRHEEVPTNWRHGTISKTGWQKYWPALHKEMVKKGEKGEKANHVSHVAIASQWRHSPWSR